MWGMILEYFTGISMKTKEEANEDFLEYFKNYYAHLHGEQRERFRNYVKRNLQEALKETYTQVLEIMGEQ